MEIKVTVEPYEQSGTLSWLASKAHTIAVQGTNSNPIVVLLDSDGKVIEKLLTVYYQYDAIKQMNMPHFRTILPKNRAWGSMPAAKREYTEAAWNALLGLVEQAKKLFVENEKLYKAHNVLIVAKDPVLESMMIAAKTDPGARMALIDYVVNKGD